ncbi:MAG: glycosyltransferase family 4 protein [Planctomycetia bacterium]
MFASQTAAARPRCDRPRVVLDLEKLRHANCGLGRFCRHLAEGLLSLGERSFDPVFFLPQTIPQETVRHFRAEGVEQIEVSPWRKETFASLYRPLLAPFQRRHRYDLWHVTNQTSKYLPLDPKVPVVLTIHDLNFLHDDRHKDRPRAVARKLADVQRKVDRATAIVTDSRYVADDVAAHLRLDGKPVHVVAPGLPTPPAASAVAPAWAPRGRFLLSIGTCLPHKNFHALFGLVEAVPDATLVIAGKRQTPYGEQLAREVAARNLGDRVLLVGQVSDGDRQWLYEHCEAFVFPSLTEGFGFPVLEAMQCGKPVFMSRRTSLPELGGAIGFYWDSFAAEHMAAVLRAGRPAVAALPDFAAAARARAAEFSWEHAARGYLRVYRSILDPAADPAILDPATA